MKKIKVAVDAPVTIGFVLICFFIFVIDSFFAKGFLSANVFNSPTNAKGAFPFIVSEPLMYAKLILYVFSTNSIQLLVLNMLLIVLLGPEMEQKYGSVIIGIMILISALFSGVLNVCFCSQPIQGCLSVIFMLAFLNVFYAIVQNKLTVSSIIVFVLVFVYEFFQKSDNGVIGILISICGGLCGSLIAFLSSPKVRAAKKSNGGGLLNKAEKELYINELDAKSPRFKFGFGKKEKKDKNKDSEETVVGTLDL